LPPTTTPLARHAPDQGTGWWADARARFASTALVQAGPHAGRSGVAVAAGGRGRGSGRRPGLASHAWRVDPASALLALPWAAMLGAMAGVYLSTFTLWASLWHVLGRSRPACVSGWEAGPGQWAGFLSAFLFSVETQQTIGYGYRSPRACPASAALVTCQVVFGQLLTATAAGLVFARLASPHRRARSVFVSEAACVARRDGVLTLTFRVGDTAVTGGRRGALPPPPTVTAHLFTWAPSPSSPASTTPPAGPGSSAAATTAEGDRLAWEVEELVLEGGGRLPPLVLPATVEHVIDAASPLAAHTPASLARCGAEVVVQVVGTSDRGERWAATRSYLGTELAWGCAFGEGVVVRALPGEGAHRVDYGSFHEVRPLLEKGGGSGGGGGGGRGRGVASASAPAPASAPTHSPSSRVRGAVPLRARPGRSLVLSDRLVLGPYGPGGAPALAARLGDTRGTSLRLRARFSLRVGDRVLNLAVDAGAGGRPGVGPLGGGMAVVGHALGPTSPLLASSSSSSGDPVAALAAVRDSSALLHVCVEGWDLAACRPVRVARTYGLKGGDLALGFAFAPAVVEEGSAPASSSWSRPRPLWSAFHAVVPAAAGPWAAGAAPVEEEEEGGEEGRPPPAFAGPGAAGRV